MRTRRVRLELRLKGGTAMIDRSEREQRLTPSSEATPRPSARMGTLAREHPELSSFTADATLLEIHGLASLEEVRRLARHRAETGRKAANRQAPGHGPRGAREALTAPPARSTGR